MKMTWHSKERIKQRTNLNHKERNTLFRNAMTKGKSPGEMKDGALKNYLLRKEKTHCQVKLYNGYVFVHSRSGKRLYTMYELPKEILEVNK